MYIHDMVVVYPFRDLLQAVRRLWKFYGSISIPFGRGDVLLEEAVERILEIGSKSHTAALTAFKIVQINDVVARSNCVDITTKRKLFRLLVEEQRVSDNLSDLIYLISSI